MASMVKFSRYGKIAALTAVGGSFYLLRDEIKPYLNLGTKVEKPPPTPIETNLDPSSRLESIEHLPEHVPYLLVGGGTASHSAMRAIRGHDPKAKVLIVNSENHRPYMRPALTKELWYSDKSIRRNLNFKWWNGKERSIFYEIDEFFIPLENLDTRPTGGVSLVKNAKLTRLDPDNKVAHLENGQTIKYDKCLLAPGGRPKTLPELDAAPKGIQNRILYFRTADDFLKLDKITETAKSIVIIGGGFLGSELACSLAKRQVDEKIPSDQIIYQIFPESGNLSKVLPQYLSEYVSKKVEKEGAHPIPNVDVKSVSMTKENAMELKLSNGQTILADYIVCAVGIEPDVELAKVSGLEVDEKTGGYLVNSELEARTDLWVAGDASCFYDMKLGRRRVEHHDHAIQSGRLAGQNMIGAGRAYTHQSTFWSDLGTDISFEAVGVIDSSLQTVAVFPDLADEETAIKEKGLDDQDKTSTSVDKQLSDSDTAKALEKWREDDKYSRGIVFYLKNDIIVGVLLWNLFSRLNIARRILNEQKKYEDLNEVAKLFNLYLDD